MSRTTSEYTLECVGGPYDGELRRIAMDKLVLLVALPTLITSFDVALAIAPPIRQGRYVRKGWGLGLDPETGMSKGWIPILHWEGE